MNSEPNSAPRLSVSWFGRSVVGCVRTNNEDSLWAGALVTAVDGDPVDGQDPTGHTLTGAAPLTRPGTLLAVADGMGGAKAGEVASGMAVSILCREMRDRAAGVGQGQEAVSDALVEAVEIANERIRDESASNPDRRGMGTTLTTIWMLDGLAQVAHVGDSRAYLFRRGNLSQITKDQSLLQKLVEDNVISLEEAKNMPVGNIILQALGSEDDLEVALPRVDLMPGDTLLLCTDGLTGVVSDAVVEESLRAGGSLEEICARLIGAAEQGGGPDNITVLIGRVESEHQAR
jgi:protein phosphatase